MKKLTTLTSLAAFATLVFVAIPAEAQRHQAQGADRVTCPGTNIKATSLAACPKAKDATPKPKK